MPADRIAALLDRAALRALQAAACEAPGIPPGATTANEHFEIDSAAGVARGECYLFALMPGAMGAANAIAGRLIDRFERRDGVWKLTSRRFEGGWGCSLET